MDNALPVRIVCAIVDRFPAVVPHLAGRARWIACAFGDLPPRLRPWLAGDAKTYEFFLSTMERLIRSVYNNDLGGEFIDVAANLIQGQFRQAYNQAWEESGLPGGFPSYLQEDLMNLVIGQFVHIDQLYKDVVDARVDEKPIGPLLARAPLWANRWNEALNRAAHLIRLANGGLEQWHLGMTEQHCSVCQALNGIVAYAQEWEMLNVHPQRGPNPALSVVYNGSRGCGGWQCDCMLTPTDKRRTDRAFEKIRRIVGG